MPDTVDYSEECDYNAIKNGIKQILLKYFECDDGGDRSPFHDPDYSAQQALDDTGFSYWKDRFLFNIV